MTGPQDPVPLLRALASAGVRHVVIGGVAVIANGYVRTTEDVDVVPAPDAANLDALAALLRDLDAVPDLGDLADATIGDPREAEVLAAGGNWRLRTRLGLLDLMQWVAGLDEDEPYAQLNGRANEAEVDGVRLRVCSREHLIAMKRAAGRPRDLDDLAHLETGPQASSSSSS